MASQFSKYTCIHVYVCVTISVASGMGQVALCDIIMSIVCCWCCQDTIVNILPSLTTELRTQKFIY